MILIKILGLTFQGFFHDCGDDDCDGEDDYDEYIMTFNDLS